MAAFSGVYAPQKWAGSESRSSMAGTWPALPALTTKGGLKTLRWLMGREKAAGACVSLSVARRGTPGTRGTGMPPLSICAAAMLACWLHSAAAVPAARKVC